MPVRVAVLHCGLTGRGAVISIAANGGCIAPHHLAEVAPRLEPRWGFLPVRQGIAVNLAVVKQVAE